MTGKGLHTVAWTEGRARTRDGVSLYYRLGGPIASGADGRRVVLIHSLAMDSSIWDSVAEYLPPDIGILAIDCRGHGRSEKPAGAYAIEMFADDIADVIASVGWSNSVIVGCSMGGCVAQSLTVRHPALVSGLVLIDTTAWYGVEARSAWHNRAEAARADGLSSLGAFQATRWFGDEFRAANAERVNDAMAIFERNDVECYASTCIMLGEVDLRAQLSQIVVGTSVIVGEEDYATPVAAARALQREIKGATLTIVPKARHLTPIERPAVIANEIRERLYPGGSRI